MDKIILSRKDIEFVLKWRDEHKDLVRVGVNPLRAVKIICTDSGVTLTAIRKAVDLRIGINQNGKSLGYLEYEFLNNGMYSMTKDRAKISNDDKQSVLTVYASVMAFMVFGRGDLKTPEHKERQTASSSKKLTKKPKKSKRSGVTLHTCLFWKRASHSCKRFTQQSTGSILCAWTLQTIQKWQSYLDCTIHERNR